MYAKAQKLADDGEYDEAEKTARAAQKLAKKRQIVRWLAKPNVNVPKAVCTISTEQFVENENSDESETTEDKISKSCTSTSMQQISMTRLVTQCNQMRK